MWKSIAAVAFVLQLASGPVEAQQAAPKPESAEAKAAMERAQRMADNPLRVILQAGKIKRKGDEAAPEPVADPAVRRTAVRTGTESTNPAPAPARPAAGGPASPTLAVSVPASVASTPLPVQAAPAPAPEPPPAKVMPSTLLSTPAAGNVPALEIAQPVEATPVTTKAVAPQAIPLAPVNVRPTLVTMVEPDIPSRLLLEAGRVGEVLADLSLREDGSVASVALLPPVPRSWQRIIITALEKWRFEPLPSARVHRVQLVFGEP